VLVTHKTEKKAANHVSAARNTKLFAILSGRLGVHTESQYRPDATVVREH
jgi:hypothetical protein